MSLHRPLAAALLALAAACRGAVPSPPDAATPPPPLTSSPARPADPFPMARATIVVAPVPARFAARPPSSAGAIERGEAPPVDFLADRLCAGDTLTARRLDAALRDAGGAGPLPEALAAWYRGLLGACPERSCEWLAGFLASDAPLTARHALWGALAGCPAARFAGVAAHPEAPPEAVLGWYAARAEVPGVGAAPLLPRFAEVARATAAAGTSEALRRLGRALGGLGPAGAPLLEALQPELSDPARRAAFDAGLDAAPLVPAAVAPDPAAADRERRLRARGLRVATLEGTSVADDGVLARLAVSLPSS